VKNGTWKSQSWFRSSTTITNQREMKEFEVGRIGVFVTNAETTLAKHFKLTKWHPKLPTLIFVSQCWVLL